MTEPDPSTPSRNLPVGRAIAALVVALCTVLLVVSHYQTRREERRAILDPVSFTGSPDEHSGGFGGFFRLTNGTGRTVEIPVFRSRAGERLEAAKPSFEILQDSGWIPLFVGYDFVPETYKVPPGSELSVWVNLGRLASSNGIVKRGIEDFQSQGAGIAYPFTARIQVGQIYSEPFEVPGK